MSQSPMSHEPVTVEILELFRKAGDSEYGGEAVTQLEHGLQAAFFAERTGASAALITAALLHDVGHLLHALPDDAPDRGIDDLHEQLASRWLALRFAREVVAPVELHVAAKRYLCAVDDAYLQTLSGPSITSLALQGGPMSASEIHEFEQLPFWSDAVQLRKWDDAAKVVDLKTPDLQHFARYVDLAARRGGPCDS